MTNKILQQFMDEVKAFNPEEYTLKEVIQMQLRMLKFKNQIINEFLNRPKK